MWRTADAAKLKSEALPFNVLLWFRRRCFPKPRLLGIFAYPLKKVYSNKKRDNCIIFYNAMILSNVLHYQTDRGDAAAAAALEQISPAAWQHINFHGRYEFTKSVQPIDIEAVVQELVTRSRSKRSTG